MGFSSLIDILGSIIIGGLLFMILLRLTETATQNTYEYSGELTVQQNLVATVQLIEYDFRKIGYCADIAQIDPVNSILAADTSSITFVTDLATSSNPMGDGTLDVLQYYVGPTTELSHTPNPRDRKFYRVENGATPKSANLGITEFKILYFDALGDTLTCPVASPGEIQTMQINLKVENPAAYNKRYVYDAGRHESQYTSAFWRQIRLAARNLKNR